MFSSGQLMDTLNTAEIYLDSCLFPFFSVSFPSFTFTFTFMHLADAFIQSDLQCIIHGYTFFYQYVCSLGIEPTTFALLTQCSTTEPQEHGTGTIPSDNLSEVFPSILMRQFLTSRA